MDTESTSPGLAILDNSTIESTLNFVSANTVIWDVDVNINITHTFASDLDIILISPQGTRITISTGNGGSNDDIFAGTLFDDSTVLTGPNREVNDFSYTNGVAASPLSPEGSLAALVGENPNGTWKLEVTDDAGGDTGTINSWGITVTTIEYPVIFSSAANGASNPNQAIADNATISSTISIAEDVIVCGLEIQTAITHTFPADLDMYLTSPEGTQLVVTTDSAGSNDDAFNGSLWGDFAGPNTVSDYPYINGVAGTPLIPEDAFFVFTGESSQGDWTLEITDDAGGDTGNLASWQIEIFTCATDARARATFEVTKDFTDNNPGEVTVAIDCNTGLILDQDKDISEARGVEFVVTEFDDGELNCTITEQPVDGYDAEYDNGTETSSTECSYTEVSYGSAFSCHITNTPAPVTVGIRKDWVFEGSSSPSDIDTRYQLGLFCDAEIEGGTHLEETCSSTEHAHGTGIAACGGYSNTLEVQTGFAMNNAKWCKTFHGDGEQLFEAGVIPEYPDSHCWVVEKVFDDAVEVDNGCSNLTVKAGQGDSCVVTNTLFFEGIPTLNSRGLALLALLMMTIGVLVIRRNGA